MLLSTTVVSVVTVVSELSGAKASFLPSPLKSNINDTIPATSRNPRPINPSTFQLQLLLPVLPALAPTEDPPCRFR